LLSAIATWAIVGVRRASAAATQTTSSTHPAAASFPGA
jgi:hypothetical protein